MTRMTNDAHDHRQLLQQIARRAMTDYGLLPDFSREAIAQAEAAVEEAPAAGATAAGTPAGGVRDLRHLLWCSIDNDDTRDLDQLSVSEPRPGGATRILVAIADVDALVPAAPRSTRTPRHNTMLGLQPAVVFPMLPERLSTDLTSLERGRRSARHGRRHGRRRTTDDVQTADVYRASCATTRSSLTTQRRRVARGRRARARGVAAVAGLDEQLQVQDDVGAASARGAACARRARLPDDRGAPRLRRQRGCIDLTEVETSRSRDLIEDFMIAANGAIARFLERRKSSTVRRVVRSRRSAGTRIADLARVHGERAPDRSRLAGARRASSRAGGQPIARRSRTYRSPSSSCSGPASTRSIARAWATPATSVWRCKDYTHSTAPNRRFADLVTQRLLKACAAGRDPAYTDGGARRDRCALHAKEDEAQRWSASCAKWRPRCCSSRRVGDVFDAIVTGVERRGLGCGSRPRRRSKGARAR